MKSAGYEQVIRCFSAGLCTWALRIILRIYAGFPQQNAQDFNRNTVSFSTTVFRSICAHIPECLSRPNQKKMGEKAAVDEICGKVPFAGSTVRGTVTARARSSGMHRKCCTWNNHPFTLSAGGGRVGAKSQSEAFREDVSGRLVHTNPGCSGLGASARA